MHRKGTMRTYECAFCGTEFQRDRKPIKGRPYCDSTCAGKQSALIRQGVTDPSHIVYDGDVAHLPLYRRDGSICAYTLIDAADAAFLSRWRWRLGNGYARRAERINGVFREIRLNRFLLDLTENDPDQGDHIDRDRLNNRRSNLRSVPHQGNSQNKTSYADSSSRYRGVSWHKRDKRWRADVKTNGKQYHIGSFNTEAEAAEAVMAARARLLPYAVD